jgi:hypothetical protein
MDAPPRPPGTWPRSSLRGRRGPFAAFVAEAARSPAAAVALGHAYVQLDPAQRRRLLEAVWADGVAEGVPMQPLLATLLAVEGEDDLADRLRGLLGGAAMRPRGFVRETRAWFTGDAIDGAAVLAQRGGEGGLEVLALAWAGRRLVFHAYEPSAAGPAVEGGASRLGLYRAEAGFVVDTIAPLLWRHRRQTGQLPPGVAHFSRLF